MLISMRSKHQPMRDLIDNFTELFNDALSERVSEGRNKAERENATVVVGLEETLAR